MKEGVEILSGLKFCGAAITSYLYNVKTKIRSYQIFQFLGIALDSRNFLRCRPNVASLASLPSQ